MVFAAFRIAWSRLTTRLPPLYHQSFQRFSSRQQLVYFNEGPHARRNPFGSSGGYSPAGWTTRQKVIAGVAVLGTGYVGMHIERAPVTGRHRIIFLNMEEEAKIGAHEFQSFIAQNRGRMYHPSHEYTKLVRRLGTRIASASSMRHLPWEFAVVEDASPNAFALPGGKVVVHSGLIRFAKSEDELAAVMSHEIAHVLQRHGAEKVALMQVLHMASIFLSVVLDWHVLRGRMGALLISLPYSRACEKEADQVGLLLAAEACFNPRAAVSLWQRFAHSTSTSAADAIPAWLSTHPSYQNRIESLSGSWMSEAQRRLAQSPRCQQLLQRWRSS